MSRVSHLLVLVAGLLAVLDVSHAKRFGRCELARRLSSLGIPRSQIADWVCLAQAESSYNTAAINRGNSNGSWDHGIFQINDRFWCGRHGSGKDCGKPCSSFRDDNISDDVQCAKKIYRRHGFSAWYAWRDNCRGRDLSSYTRGCNL